ncbi:Sorting nexin-22 isoform X1 [Aix galericulata]|nr:Sorting nexin-22 isoform X1 [Aix galericulata]
MIVVSIPAAEPEATARSPEKAHTGDGEDEEVQVFLVEVLCNGRRHTVAKRYSEFQALHKRIKKTCKVPDFPPRRVPNWVPKVLEQRRQGLELYIQVRQPRAAAAPRILGVLISPPSLPQGVLCHNKELPQDVLDFLKGGSGALQVLRGFSPCSTSPPPSQRPVLGFHTDPYVRLPVTDALPDTVLSGVLQGLYAPWSCSPRAAVAQGQPGS